MDTIIFTGLVFGAMIAGAVLVIVLIGKNLNKHMRPCSMCGHSYYEENLKVVIRTCPICLEYADSKQLA
jgi:hypothetical protein